MRARQRVGFMQGRLSPPVDGRIQAFPRTHWRAEFLLARSHGFRVMEWTLDAECLAENPLITAAGQAELRQLAADCALSVPSVTGDFFMQAPFFRAEGLQRQARLDDLSRVLAACATLSIPWLVLPLVDGGRVADGSEADAVLETVAGLQTREAGGAVTVLLESDLPPPALRALMARLPDGAFGVNFDIGNSAALGFAAGQEVAALSPWIRNVHVKDRLRGGPTVPLGRGAADLPGAIAALAAAGYEGNLILQTARAADGDDVGVLARYRDMVCDWMVAA